MHNAWPSGITVTESLLRAQVTKFYVVPQKTQNKTRTCSAFCKYSVILRWPSEMLWFITRTHQLPRMRTPCRSRSTTGGSRLQRKRAFLTTASRSHSRWQSVVPAVEGHWGMQWLASYWQEKDMQQVHSSTVAGGCRLSQQQSTDLTVAGCCYMWQLANQWQQKTSYRR